MKAFFTTTLAFLSLAHVSVADEGTDFFEKKIRPALEKYCYECHSDRENKIRGGLLVDTKNGLLQGGDSGPAIVPNKLQESLLWDAINHRGEFKMPKNKMPEEVIADFKRWIEMGAPDPRIQQNVLVKTKVTAESIAKARSFWSLLPPVYKEPKTQVPNLVDAYVADGLAEVGLKPSPAANAAEMLSRLHFDLIGLPPSPEEVARFTLAYQKNPEAAVTAVADKLLASPQFGERWGRHWLDIARYAESTGREFNSTYPDAWRYRDYVIASFNADKPYDQFLKEQIAGDLLKVKTDEEWAQNLIATGFLALGPKSLPSQDARQFKADLIDEQIDVVTRGLMGLTVACARCHDHKFEAIPQSDYYALAGIFQSSQTLYGTVVGLQNRNRTSRIRLPVVASDDPHAELINPSELANLRKSLDEAEAELRAAIQARREEQKKGANAQADLREITLATRKVATLTEKVNSVNSDGSPRSFCVGLQPAAPTQAKILERGEVSKPGQSIERGLVQLIGSATAITKESSGRLELAQWIASKDNPLTARVMVNRIWLHLFGQGIVTSPDDFGVTGRPPSHPEMLDALALQFIQDGWSMKKLIRGIVTSSTYRQSSSFNSSSFAKDPQNEKLWRVTPSRLDAEALRDRLLAVCGTLKLEPPRGSAVGKAGHSALDPVFKQISTAASQRKDCRSVYLPVLRDNLPAMLDTFDMTDSMIAESQRESNSTAAQALFMLNNELIRDCADILAARLEKEHPGKLDEQLQRAFQLCFLRQASSVEISGARKLYNSVRNDSSTKNNKKGKGEAEALSAVCQALFASAEFRYK